MKRRITITCHVLSGILIASQFGVWNACIMFMLVGTIPGTNYSLPPAAMFFITTTAACLVAARFVFSMYTDDSETKTPRLPKRRYSRA